MNFCTRLRSIYGVASGGFKINFNCSEQPKFFLYVSRVFSGSRACMYILDQTMYAVSLVENISDH